MRIVTELSYYLGFKVPAEQEKMKNLFINYGASASNASRFAKTAYKNGWTYSILLRLLGTLNSQTINMDIGLSIIFMTDKGDSTFEVQLEGEHKYVVTIHLGSDTRTLTESIVESAAIHEIRHIKIVEYLYANIRNYDERSGDIFNFITDKAKGFRKKGDLEQLITRLFDDMKLFAELYRISYNPSDPLYGIGLFRTTIVDESLVWANATQQEISGGLFQEAADRIFNQTIDSGNTKMAAFYAIGVKTRAALFKALSDKLKTPIKNQRFNDLVRQYGKDPYFTDIYNYVCLCIDVAQKYFPK